MTHPGAPLDMGLLHSTPSYTNSEQSPTMQMSPEAGRLSGSQGVNQGKCPWQGWLREMGKSPP